MKRCVSCGFENANESKFCKKCGTKLENEVKKKGCYFCGKEVAEGALYCKYCGKPINSVGSIDYDETLVLNNKHSDSDNSKNSKNTLVVLLIVFFIAFLIVIGGFFLKQYMENDSDKNSDKRVEENNKNDKEDKNDEEDKISENDTEDTEDVVEPNKIVNTTKPIPLSAVVSASSKLSDAYKVEGLTDFNVNTAWGVEGIGTNESVVYRFSEEKDIYGIAILPGNLNTSDEFYDYAYPTKLEITAGEKTQTVKISEFSPDSNYSGNVFLYINLEEPIYAQEVTISIDSTKKGKKIDATCITEMHLYTYPIKGNEQEFSVGAWKVTYNANTNIESVDYILPNSNTRKLTEADLQGLSSEECRIARNEIYARHGRKFSDQTLQEYFESKTWYIGQVEPNEFDESVLNESEKANAELISKYEKEQGYTQ